MMNFFVFQGFLRGSASTLGILFIGLSLLTGCAGAQNRNQDSNIDVDSNIEVPAGLQYEAAGGGVRITKYSGSAAALVIPSQIQGVPVTAIGDKAFSGCERLTNVAIPASVTAIGDSAFYWCGNLTSIQVAEGNPQYGSVEGVLFTKDRTALLCYPAGKQDTLYAIPNSVKQIGDYAFAGCGLTSAAIPTSVTAIGDRAFYDCGGLTSIEVVEGNPQYGSVGGVLFTKDRTALLCYPAGKQDTLYAIPNSVKQIGDYAFAWCRGLTSVAIPTSVIAIGNGAFFWCSRLTSIEVAEGNPQYGSVGGVLFTKDRTALLCYPAGKPDAIYTIPNSVKQIRDYAFFLCGLTSLTSVAIPTSVTTIGNYAFAWCRGLTSIAIPDSVTAIGDSAFAECYGLTSVTIPDSVTAIGDSTFDGCSGLTSVTIPASVTAIGDSAFSWCGNLTSIQVAEGNPWYGSVGGVLFTKDRTALLCYPAGKQDAAYTIPNSVKQIRDYAFAGCSGLTSAAIPDSVTAIGDSAFAGCSGLTSVAIPDSVTTIGNRAFSWCRGLTSIAIPDSVTAIGDSAFAECERLTSAAIPASVTAIGNRAFAECYRLTSIQVAEGNPQYTSVGGVLFTKDRTALLCYPAGKQDAAYTIPNSVKQIRDYAFARCDRLTSVAIPASITVIGYGAFAGCSGLTSVAIPASITAIGDYTFAGCSGLTSVVIPDSVTAIGDSAFSWCTNLKGVILSRKTQISSDAFPRGVQLTYSD